MARGTRRPRGLIPLRACYPSTTFVPKHVRWAARGTPAETAYSCRDRELDRAPDARPGCRLRPAGKKTFLEQRRSCFVNDRHHFVRICASVVGERVEPEAVDGRHGLPATEAPGSGFAGPNVERSSRFPPARHHRRVDTWPHSRSAAAVVDFPAPAASDEGHGLFAKCHSACVQSTVTPRKP